MNEKLRKHFEKLWKVKLLKQSREIEKEKNARITRSLEQDYLRCLKFMEYGFLEGVKFKRNEK